MQDMSKETFKKYWKPEKESVTDVKKLYSLCGVVAFKARPQARDCLPNYQSENSCYYRLKVRGKW